MPSLSDLRSRVAMALPSKPNDVCECHNRDYAPWTGEIHGLSQALMSKSRGQRIFWWIVLAVCVVCGTATTALVIMEYVQGPTATSTTIKMVNSLEFPSITVCPKVPDSFDFPAILEDIRQFLPSIDEVTARDLIGYWIAGSGLENMDDVPNYNETYNDYLEDLYSTWSRGYEVGDFFNKTWTEFGFKCEQFLSKCQLGGKTVSCCQDIFHPKPVMRRGLCYQTRRDVNQTEADDIGRLVVEMKELPSATYKSFNYSQPQVIVYITDNFDYIIDFPRFYLYPHEWNRMHFTARYIDLLEHPEDCTHKIFGKDALCFVRNWMYSSIVEPYNCTLPYMKSVVNDVPTCLPSEIVPDYYNSIQLVHSGSLTTHDCIPGCQRWEYSVSLQQSAALTPFEDHAFNLEVSFYDLQYENVREVFTTSVPGFFSQIGGQFGFFLGLSIITMVQIVVSAVTTASTFVYTRVQLFVRRRKRVTDVG